jgi:preprotein translocase subunit SecA
MRAAALPNRATALGPYPERSGEGDEGAPRYSGWQLAAVVSQRKQRRFLAAVETHSGTARGLSASAFQARVREVRARLGAEGFADTPMAEAFALVREATRRTLGMEQFHTQLIAARIMLDNRLAEMATGEGKTLAAAVAAATAALAGTPVHVITSNDYLVDRDAEHLGPVYCLLGLSVGAVTRPLDQAQRRAAYACDIAYCTAKELTFDYLRDRLVRRHLPSELHDRVRHLEGGQAESTGLLLRGLWMALVDEADSILIDEARTPLILSQPRVNPQQQAYVQEALRMALHLVAGRDFRLDPSTQQADLTPGGRNLLAQRAQALGGLWQDRRHRDEIVGLALAAHHLLFRDQHYLVRDRKIVMIDQTTGRVAPGRVWSRGLQQLLEAKEGCPPSGEMETIAQITYQRFFPRYLRLCGMSGTLTEAQAELRSVYGLRVQRVPLRKPSRRRNLGTRVFVIGEDKWQAVVERVRRLQQAGRPVLIGTDSVADSDQLSIRLAAACIEHQVLNARQDSEEAAMVARAGEPGRVTVTTNMAGRGTDIPLAAGVAERGGLHVICCQHNSSPRIDRQLHGRAARQGDPGSVETILSLQDGLLARSLPGPLRGAAIAMAGVRRLLPARIGMFLARLPQRQEERRQRAQRKLLLKQDRNSEGRLSFAGRGE